jgi:hypothetical protein
VPIRVVSTTPSSEPGGLVSEHRALQGLAFRPSVTTGLVISVAFTAAPLPLPGSRLTRDASGTKQLIDPKSVNPLTPFPTWTALPSSEYYDASDAQALHWGTAPLRAWASHVHHDVLCERT